MFKIPKIQTVLRKNQFKDEWYILIEISPVIENGVKKRKRIQTGYSVTSVLWDTDKGKGTKNYPLRDAKGMILCTDSEDQRACRKAEGYRQVILNDYEKHYQKISILSEEEIELLNKNEESEQDFFTFFASLNKRSPKHKSKSIMINWDRCLELLKQHTGKDKLPIKEINQKLVEEFRDFLLSAPQKGKKGILSENSARTYFNIFKAVISKCHKEGYLKKNVSEDVEPIVPPEPAINFLWPEEFQKLVMAQCDTPVLYRASIFSVLTGLRHSDIKKLKWRDIQNSNCQDRIIFKQKKTSQMTYLPICSDARKICGERQADDKPVFEDLQDISWISRPLARWIKSAGITKHITFHCFRHTFAIHQLMAGTDILTLSKMMGHSKLESTLHYAKIVDKLKEKASKAVKYDFSPIIEFKKIKTNL